MPAISGDQRDALEKFIASLADIPWLANAGDPHPHAIVAEDFLDGWDEWHNQMMKVWLPQTHRLEQLAVAEIGEAGLNEIFAAVSESIADPVTAAMEIYFDTRSTDELNADRGLWPEWLDTIKRDISWAAVEAVLNQPDLFTSLLDYYRAGRWPCAFENGDRAGRIVLL